MIIEMTGAEWFTTRPGGLNRYFESLYLALRDQPGVEVHATAFGDAPAGGHSWGPAANGLASRHLTSRRRTPGLKPTVIDRHFAPYGPGIPVRSKTPFVLHFHGPWYAESRAAGQSEVAVNAKHAFEALRYFRADHAVVLSAEFRDILHERYRFPESRISVIPPGVDLARFQSAPAPTGPPLVLCVRRLERRMGIDVLIAAWESVIRATPDARLVVVGDGTERGALQEQIEQLGLTGSITLAGRVDDESLGRYYREASLTVIPTRSLEGFGLIALESLASGRAPVVTRCGGLPDAVNGLDPSLVVPIEDVEALADRITRGLAGELPDADACRRHAETFDWKDVAARHVDLYQRLSG